MSVERLSTDEIESGASAAFTVYPGQQYPSVVLLCEHGGNAVPSPWKDLGIPRAFFDTHFGSDIGAAELTINVAERLGATAIVSNYSRLFLDYNRHSNDPDCFKLDMGGIPIPANQRLSETEIQLRERYARLPLERAIDQWTLAEATKPALLISIHSFSPVWNNQIRECEIGVMWREDTRLAHPLIEALRQGDIKVDDNQPYDFRTSDWFTLKRHGLDVGVPCAYIEIRNSFLIENGLQIRATEIISNAVGHCIRNLTA